MALARPGESGEEEAHGEGIVQVPQRVDKGWVPAAGQEGEGGITASPTATRNQPGLQQPAETSLENGNGLSQPPRGSRVVCGDGGDAAGQPGPHRSPQLISAEENPPLGEPGSPLLHDVVELVAGLVVLQPLRRAPLALAVRLPQLADEDLQAQGELSTGEGGQNATYPPHTHKGPSGRAGTLYSRNLLTMGSWRRNLMSLRR